MDEMKIRKAGQGLIVTYDGDEIVVMGYKTLFRYMKEVFGLLGNSRPGATPKKPTAKPPKKSRKRTRINLSKEK